MAGSVLQIDRHCENFYVIKSSRSFCFVFMKTFGQDRVGGGKPETWHAELRCKHCFLGGFYLQLLDLVSPVTPV